MKIFCKHVSKKKLYKGHILKLSYSIAMSPKKCYFNDISPKKSYLHKITTHKIILMPYLQNNAILN